MFNTRVIKIDIAALFIVYFVYLYLLIHHIYIQLTIHSILSKSPSSVTASGFEMKADICEFYGQVNLERKYTK